LFLKKNNVTNIYMVKEISLRDLRKLVSKLNKSDRIEGVYSRTNPKTKAQLMTEVEKKGYIIDHEKKQLRPRVQMMRRKVIKLN
tara:strand:- start:35 stop:286 length:252 start_codon:yes stop_codon:yes gene_type:complete